MRRTYYGIHIEEGSSVYWRWSAWIDTDQSVIGMGGTFHADTLDGMKQLIRHVLGKGR